MKLSETTFKVSFNEKFMRILDIDMDQIGWMVVQAANLMTVDKWEINEAAFNRDEELDCWQHDILLPNGELIVAEAIPYPKSHLALWTPQFAEETVPDSRDPATKTFQYPTDFTKYLDKNPEYLGVFKIKENVIYNGFQVGDKVLISSDFGKTFEIHASVLDISDAILITNMVNDHRGKQTCYKVISAEDASTKHI